jgi:medium-chain acyl-[acyl-carrier-protein] hydrolase
VVNRTSLASWFRGEQRIGAGATLICLPHAGGGASAFRQWRAWVPPAVDVLAVQFPGHEGRWLEPLGDRMEDLAVPLATIVAERVTTPFALYGHSLGALIAFEAARAMRARGYATPVHLFVSCCRAPSIPAHRPSFEGRSDAALVRYLRRLGGLPEAVLAHRAMLDALLPVIRADFRIDDTYVHRPAPPLDCPITSFVGASDAGVSRAENDAWRSHTRGEFRSLTLPAGHFWPPACEAEIAATIGAALTTRCAARRPA